MTTTIISNHEEQALDRLLWQYDGSTLMQDLIKALFTNQTQIMEDSFREVYDRLDIDSQSGLQLDNIGGLVGQTRLGFDDATYKILIRARIGRNVSEGDIERIISSWKLLTGASIVQLIEVFPAEINLYSTSPLSDSLIDVALLLINETAVAGVAINYIAVYESGGSFGFDGNDDVLGFGDSTNLDVGGKFAYIQTSSDFTIISDPTDAFGFDGPDTNIKGFSNTLFPTLGGKLSYIDLS